ncbi:hypothetical protein N9O96_03810 [Amylibacter sp.]|nr:hypothetical protein [Amylibacter sp.]
MSHDTEAAWATSEIAKLIKKNPVDYFQKSPPSTKDCDTVATNEGRGGGWPIADGLIEIEIPNQNKKYKVALEYKRPNEGLHGILTAMGQAHSYLHKGYDAVCIVIPRIYNSHSAPTDFIDQVLGQCSPDMPIAVFGYDEADPSKMSPFAGKLDYVRKLNLGANTRATSKKIISKTATQWAHVREGSTYPDAFYRYLQSAKLISGYDNEPNYVLPAKLLDAVKRLNSKVDPIKYLSSTSFDDYHNQVWRNYWYENVLYEENCELFTLKGSTRIVAKVPTKILTWDGKPSEYWSAKKNSIKQKCLANIKSGAWTEDKAWEMFAATINRDAHSKREDLDSGLSAFGFLEHDGYPSTKGYAFVDATSRSGDANSGTPLMIFAQQMLTDGNFEAFIHYIHKLSEEAMKNDPYSFFDHKKKKLDSKAYLQYLKDDMINKLYVYRAVKARGGVARGNFQGELAILRALGIVGNFRLGLGLEINWSKMQSYLNYSIR